ncbi:MAG: YihY/virulence factor BrkB family protein [Ornithinimicrobium sp.]
MTFRRQVRAVLTPIPGAMPLARAVVETVAICLRYRVTGLASEAAFFTLLSLPPLFLGVIAGVGFLGQQLGADTIGTVTSAIESYSRRFLTEQTVAEVISPTIRDTLEGGRGDLLSIGFLLSFWSGSRALHVFMDTIGIMYGQNGERGILKARAMSLALYVGSIFAMGITLPLVILGPSLLRDLIPPPFDFVVELYWPVVAVLGLISLTGLFHFATPMKSPFYRDLPGAIVAIVIWVLASLILRSWATQAIGGTSVYGPLSAPIVLMIWLYFMAIAVLIGAALNAALRRLWPADDYRGPVSRATDWWDANVTQPMQRRPLSPVTFPEEERRQRPPEEPPESKAG